MSRLHLYKTLFTKYFPLRFSTLPIRHSGSAMVLGAQESLILRRPASLSSCNPPLLFTLTYSPSSRVTIAFTIMFVVKTFVSEKHLSLVDRGQRGMEGNITVDIKAVTSNAFAPTNRPTSFSSVTVLRYFPLYLLRTTKRQYHYSHYFQFFQAVRLLIFFFRKAKDSHLTLDTIILKSFMGFLSHTR